MSDALAKYRAGVSEGALSPAQAKADLAAARERTKQKLAALEVELSNVLSWRAYVRRHPVATVVGAFALGLTLSALLRRR